jgi:hypothetical protein
MDYAFVPGLATGDPYLATINSALPLHPNLSLLSPTPDTLSDFLILAKTDNATVPSEDLIIGTHATDEGVILVAVDSTIPAPITYEKLQNATSIKLPTELNKPGASVRIFGCIIGSDNSLPLLKQLKQSLGNPHAVVAPKYLYGVGSYGGGFVETMLYDFRILSPTALASRDAVKQAFQAGSNATPPQFVDVNGTKISPDLWDTWLPSASQMQLKPATRHQIPFTVKATVPVLSNPSVTVKLDVQAFWVAIHEGPVTLQHVDTGEGENTKKSKKELAQAGIPNDDRFKSSHPYPYYKRYYYSSAQSLIDGVNWLVAAFESGTKWQLTFDRYVYELFIPITEPPSDTLICNYYHLGRPPIGSMFQGHTVDARLFASV